MADIKWIKITTDMFDNRKIKHLRKMPEGNSIVLIWVMLLTMAGRCNAGGMIFLTENIPYTPKMLADELDFDESIVRLALMALENLNMIRSDGFLTITGWEEHQNVDGMERIREQTRKRVANYRERQKLLEMPKGSVCQYCGAVATGVDHIIATSRGGTDTTDNKVPCCIECNRIKNDKPLVDFLNKNRERIDDEIVLSNPKLTAHVTLCNATNRYIVTQRNAIDKEIEGDKEKDSEEENIPPISPQGEKEKPEIEIPFSGELREAFDDWIAYKKEKRQSYQPRGLKSLITQIRRYADQFGESETANAIRNSMASNYQGIVFDQISKNGSAMQKTEPKKKKTFLDMYLEDES